MRERAFFDDLRVPGAIHWLHCCALAVVREGEHVLAKVLPVPAAIPNGASQQLGSAHFFEAVTRRPSAHHGLQRAVKRVAARMPKHHAGRLLLQMKEVELLAEDAMITGFEHDFS